jgi:transposase
MGKKEAVPNRRYTEEFKTEAVRMAQSTGGNAAAKRLGIPQSTITNWVRRRREGESVGGAGAGAAVAVKRPVSELEAENARLRRELASAKLDLEIVKKAAAYFAKESR